MRSTVWAHCRPDGVTNSCLASGTAGSFAPFDQCGPIITTNPDTRDIDVPKRPLLRRFHRRPVHVSHISERNLLRSYAEGYQLLELGRSKFVDHRRDAFVDRDLVIQRPKHGRNGLLLHVSRIRDTHFPKFGLPNAGNRGAAGPIVKVRLHCLALKCIVQIPTIQHTRLSSQRVKPLRDRQRFIVDHDRTFSEWSLRCKNHIEASKRLRHPARIGFFRNVPRFLERDFPVLDCLG